jgi:hypothetical protein
MQTSGISFRISPEWVGILKSPLCNLFMTPQKVLNAAQRSYLTAIATLRNGFQLSQTTAAKTTLADRTLSVVLTTKPAPNLQETVSDTVKGIRGLGVSINSFLTIGGLTIDEDLLGKRAKTGLTPTESIQCWRWSVQDSVQNVLSLMSVLWRCWG